MSGASYLVGDFSVDYGLILYLVLWLLLPLQCSSASLRGVSVKDEKLILGRLRCVSLLVLILISTSFSCANSPVLSVTATINLKGQLLSHIVTMPPAEGN